MWDEKVSVGKRGFLWWWEGLEESELRWQETRGRDGTVLSPLPSGLQHCCRLIWDFPFYVPYSACSSVGKESACSAGDPGSIPGLGRSPGEGNGNPLQYPYLENLMDRGLQSMGSQRVRHDWATNTYLQYMYIIFPQIISLKEGSLAQTLGLASYLVPFDAPRLNYWNGSLYSFSIAV